LAELDRYGVTTVLFRQSGNPLEWAHVGQFAAVLDQSPERSETVATVQAATPIRILHVRRATPAPPDAEALTRLSGPQALMK